MRIITALLLGYLFFLSWTSAFALHPLLPIHVILCVFAIVLIALHSLLTRNKLKVDIYGHEDILISLFLIFFIFAALNNPTSASINYISAYIYVFVFAYLGLKGAFYNYLNTAKIKKWALYGVVFTAAFSIFEFIIQYSTDFDFDSILFRVRAGEAVYNRLLPRSYAFSTEPGILAFYLETIGIIAIWIAINQNWSKWYKLFVVGIIILGWMLTFSAASVAAMAISSLLILIIKFFRSRSFKEYFYYYLAIPVIFICGYLIISIASDSILSQIISKLTFAESSLSANRRVQEWIEGINFIMEHPFWGIGPGSAAAENRDSTISWYLFLTKESGLITLFPLLLFLAFKFFKILKSSLKGRLIYLFAFINGAVHLAVISTFFHPFLWSLLIIFEVLDHRNGNKFI